VKVASLGTGVKAVAAGSGFSLALMKDGTVRSWGDDFYGQLSNGADPFGDEPGPVGNLSNVKAIATDGDAAHVLALLENGTVRSWGRNNDGQLGDGSILPGTSRETPVRGWRISRGSRPWPSRGPLPGAACEWRGQVLG
jgi:alpha-tubulin suppressor-like RCC1 family protein